MADLQILASLANRRERDPESDEEIGPAYVKLDQLDKVSCCLYQIPRHAFPSELLCRSLLATGRCHSRRCYLIVWTTLSTFSTKVVPRNSLLLPDDKSAGYIENMVQIGKGLVKSGDGMKLHRVIGTECNMTAEESDRAIFENGGRLFGDPADGGPYPWQDDVTPFV